MNNGRYMTIADLALIEYFIRSGFLKAALRRGWRPMLGGSMISFRHGLRPFRRHTLRFSIACWDERWFEECFRPARTPNLLGLFGRVTIQGFGVLTILAQQRWGFGLVGI